MKVFGYVLSVVLALLGLMFILGSQGMAGRLAVGAILFDWSLPEESPPEGIEGRPSLGTLYEYAGFFLNSVGGRSYLLRRDSRVRILTTYYCVLIVDRANQEEANRHGIDIRPHIDSVAEEIGNHRGLVFQKEYLDALAGLQEKYTSR